jgi:pimeloyl-ACP methyl ester carboxylesterase
VRGLRLHRSDAGDGRPLLVLHEVGQAGAGAAWQNLLDAWPGPAVAPDLPGHGGSDPPVGAKWVPSDLALVAVRALAECGLTDPVVIGHGWGGHAAESLAAAGRVSALVLVDGLGEPWQSHQQLAEDTRRWLRGMLDDPLLDAAVESRPDPLVRHGFPSVWERGYVTGLRAAVQVPLVALESPASPTPSGERDERAAAFGGESAWLPIGAATSDVVMAALVGQPGWWG